jgi:NAD(P)-dependent dehydrogenase (short-subunit alcohol dehydrogenase family)
MTDQKQRLNVLVTGAGSGIGGAVAERLAAAGHRVVGTVRTPERARLLTEKAASTSRDLRFVPLELSSSEHVRSLAADLLASGGVDVLVHNAGFGVFGAVEEVGADAVRRQFEVNVFGPLELTRLLLPDLRERRGQMIWIGSLAGRIALPFQAHYSATKAALASFSDALRVELAPFGVRVTCIEPGDFSTGFTDARIVTRPEASPYREALERCLAAVDEQERGGPHPEWVGRVVERLTRTATPPARQPVGKGARAMCALARVLPDRLRERIVSRHYRQTM